MNYYLFSPIGSTDPIRNYRDGALIHICRKYKPKKIVLFLSQEILENHKLDNRYCLSIEALKKEPGVEDWNPSIDIIERADLKEVQKMDNFISEFKSGIELLKKCCEEGDKIILNVSSGTPAMKYSLQLLSTENKDLFIPVQVDTPKKACNSDIKIYDVEAEWLCNEDNDPAGFVDRCNISENENLFVYLLKEKITELIKNYDYSGALTVAKSIESYLSKDFIALLDAAKQRLALNYRPANDIFKKYGYKILFNETGDLAKLCEYILYLNIKLKTDNYIEFTRGITPLFEDLLFHIVKDKASAYIITMRDRTPKWDVQKLLSSPEFDDLEFVKNINPCCKYGTMYIRSENLIDIIKKYYPSDSELINNIDNIREFESKTRNTVAHEIKPLNNNDIENCKNVFKNIEKLTVKAKIIRKEDFRNFLNSYDNMNEFLLSKCSLV